MTIPYNFDPLGSTLMVPYKPNIVVWEARPQPENGGQDNVTATIKLYPGIYEFLLVGGGSNSAYGGWDGYSGGSGSAWKGRVRVTKTVEVQVQAGAKTNKNTYPLHKDSFVGNWITAQGAGGATDNNWDAFFSGAVVINAVDYGTIISTELSVNTQRDNSYQPIAGTNYGQCFYTGYAKITYLGQRV